VVIEVGRFGRGAPGVAVGRPIPLPCTIWLAPSFLWTLTWLLSTEPDALRFSCGDWTAPLVLPAGRATGFGAPAGAAGLGAVVVFGAVGSTIDMISLNAYKTMVSTCALALLGAGLLTLMVAADKRLTQCYRSCLWQKLYMLSRAEKQD
jgi:hypothetical protein